MVLRYIQGYTTIDASKTLLNPHTMTTVLSTGISLEFPPHAPMYRRSLSLAERAPLAAASITINAVFVALAALALCIRYMSRRLKGVPLTFNDYAALLAYVRIVKSLS